jgi:multidrug efflux pump subunit AcrA (membrane-fusion protein)
VFADWQKADAEIAFAEKQLQSTEKLAQTTLEAHQLTVERLVKLVQVGTEAAKDLAEAKAALIQAEIQGQKEVYEAQAAVRLAQREKAALARQLTLEGLQPELLVSVSRDLDIIMAEVPESMIKHVVIGQSWVAKFFSHPEKQFYGKVLSIVPVLSKELRSLRVLFTIEDAADLLRPGMFAEIGLGVDPRLVLQVPPESIVHIGDSDYVLVRKSESDWMVTEVQIGEQHESGVEVYTGLDEGDQVAGKGVILLKPVISESLRMKSLLGINFGGQR